MSCLVVTTADGEKIVGSDDVGLKGTVSRRTLLKREGVTPRAVFI